MFGLPGRELRTWRKTFLDFATGKLTKRDVAECPEDVRLLLAGLKDEVIDEVLCALPSTTAQVLDVLSYSDSIFTLRRVAAHPEIDTSTLDRLCQRDEEVVRESAARSSRISVESAVHLAVVGSTPVKLALLRNYDAPRLILQILAEDDDPAIVNGVVGHPHVDVEVLRRIASRRFSDRSAGSRYAASQLNLRLKRQYDYKTAGLLTRALIHAPLAKATSEVISDTLAMLAALSMEERDSMSAMLATLPRSMTLEQLADVAAAPGRTVHTSRPADPGKPSTKDQSKTQGL